MLIINKNIDPIKLQVSNFYVKLNLDIKEVFVSTEDWWTNFTA